jgi:hypothetical protein
MTLLRDLFQTKVLANGRTAEAEFEVKNSKDIRITTSDPILNTTVFPLVQKTVRNSSALTRRKRETLLEAETTGLRIISGLSSPVLYGTESIRILQRTTPVLEIMKMGANGSSSEGSTFISNIINKGSDAVKTTLESKLWAKFPTKLIPTSIKEKMISSGYSFPLTPDQLADIQNDGAGNIIGKFIQKTIQGTPSQIGRAVVGQTISSIKDTVRNKLFDGRTIEGRNISQLPNNSIIYNNKNKYSKTVDTIQDTPIDKRNDLASVYDEKLKLIEKGTTDFSKEFAGGSGLPTKVSKNKYSDSTTYTNDIHIKRNRLEGRFDMDSRRDILNRETAWYSEDGNPPDIGNQTTLDNYSMIPLRFYSISKKSGISFRAVIDGLSESFSPSWESSRFVGNPYSFYTYSSIDRSVSFNFKIFSLNMEEHKSMWQKISLLTTMVYPQQYANPYITPPFIKFTLGNMYKNKEAFIESLTYSVDDNTPWELGLRHNDERGNPINDNSMKDYKLPTIISVQITLKFVESQSSHWSPTSAETNTVYIPHRMYDYGAPTRNQRTISERRRNLNPDGSAKDTKTSALESIPGRSFDMLPSDSLLKTATKNLNPDAKKGDEDVVLSGLSSIKNKTDSITIIRN